MARAIPRRLRASHDSTVKEQGSRTPGPATRGRHRFTLHYEGKALWLSTVEPPRTLPACGARCGAARQMIPMTTRTHNRLTTRKVEALDRPGRHADGGGLYLAVRDNGSKSWSFLYSLHGKRRELGLGSVRDVPLARARELAAEARQAITKGENPISPKHSKRSAGASSFAACAEHLIASLEPSWRSPIHAQQWRATLAKEAARLSPLPVDKITTEDVLAVLQPLWQTKRITADRLRARIERVLDAAKARKLIASPYENPARWRGHLDHILPRRKRLEQQHHAALPYDQVPAFLRELQAREGLGARALQLAILTAMRTGETRGARWDEIDLEGAVWVIPGERMKSGRTHRVPLSRAALPVRGAGDARARAGGGCQARLQHRASRASRRGARREGGTEGRQRSQQRKR